jgi:5-methylcytosine-specific restriction endonuclease McrA
VNRRGNAGIAQYTQPRVAKTSTVSAALVVEETSEQPGPMAVLPAERPGQHGSSTRSRVLVLNASYEPINVCTVRRATVLVLKRRAEVVEESDWALHAESFTMQRPLVIRLTAYVKIPRDAHSRKITRRAVFARDRWTCQYCGSERGSLTVDHVVPRSKGGGSGWDNIVACCAPCNRRKGDRLPKDANMHPRRQPKAPHSTIFVYVATPSIPDAWHPYLVAA